MGTFIVILWGRNWKLERALLERVSSIKVRTRKPCETNASRSIQEQANIHVISDARLISPGLT